MPGWTWFSRREALGTGSGRRKGVFYYRKQEMRTKEANFQCFRVAYFEVFLAWERVKEGGILNMGERFKYLGLEKEPAM